MEQIVIVIVHYENENDTKECLASLDKIKAANFSYRVLVVDNGSSKLFKLPRSLSNKRVEVIRSESNLGFTGGNNLGLHYAFQNYDPDYYLLLNNDTVVEPNFLQILHNYARQNVEVGLVTSKIYFAKGREFHAGYVAKDKGNVIWYAGGSIDWSNLAAFHRGVDELDRSQFDQLQNVDFVTGCVMLIPKSVFEKVGYLDKRYFLYLEDVDYSFRVRKAGYKLVMCPESIVWHKNAGSSGGAGSNLHLYYQERNRLFFVLKYASWRIKVTAVRVLIEYLIGKSGIKRKAALDLLLQNMGKQPLL